MRFAVARRRCLFVSFVSRMLHVVQRFKGRLRQKRAASPSQRGVRFVGSLARFLTFLFAGKATFIGRENLDAVDGPGMICPNHPHCLDVAVVPLLLNRPARYMTHPQLMKSIFGLLGFLFKRAGAFSARDPEGYRAGVAAMTSGQMVVVFPEGRTSFDTRLQRFRKGAVHIAQESARLLARPTFIVPVYIRYGCYPGAWIRRFDAPIQYLLVLLAFPLYRRGVTVVVGKPISTTELPTDPKAATRLLAVRIAELDQATGMACTPISHSPCCTETRDQLVSSPLAETRQSLAG